MLLPFLIYERQLLAVYSLNFRCWNWHINVLTVHTTYSKHAIVSNFGLFYIIEYQVCKNYFMQVAMQLYHGFF